MAGGVVEVVAGGVVGTVAGGVGLTGATGAVDDGLFASGMTGIDGKSGGKPLSVEPCEKSSFRSDGLTLDFDLLDFESVSLVIAEESSSKAECVLLFVKITIIIKRMIQPMAKPTVILVNTSPALVPNALEPPTPPNAPASPPPFPRWIRMIPIRKNESKEMTTFKMPMMIPTGSALRFDFQLVMLVCAG